MTFWLNILRFPFCAPSIIAICFSQLRPPNVLLGAEVGQVLQDGQYLRLLYLGILFSHQDIKSIKASMEELIVQRDVASVSIQLFIKHPEDFIDICLVNYLSAFRLALFADTALGPTSWFIRFPSIILWVLAHHTSPYVLEICISAEKITTLTFILVILIFFIIISVSIWESVEWKLIYK